MLDLHTVELLLDLPCLSVSSVLVEKGKLSISCCSILEENICPCCLQKLSQVKKRNTRIVRDLPIVGKVVELHLESRQFYCPDCNRYAQEHFEFVGDSRTMTNRYEKHVYECCRHSTIERVVTQENIVWDSVQAIFTRYAKQETAFLSNYQPTRIGIDEFAIKKGHKDFATVLVDLDTGYVLDVLNFRLKDELIVYFKAKGDVFCSKIEVFSCDLWEGFISTAQTVFPNAAIIADRFHCSKLLNEVLDKERRKLRREFKQEAEYKNIKWLLFKHWETLNDKQKRTLLKVFRKSSILRQLYFAKNEWRNIFEDNISKNKAQDLLQTWIEDAKKLNHQGLNTFIKTLETHFEIILNFFTHRISNGIVEGTNNVIKMIKRTGFGFRNFDNFKLKILCQFV
ncbi:MAG TPA: ISL3 family transposase [Chitinophagales bacterium]|nr:ISL3 family transposase [Chitinophagales bacterium]HNL06241.1 ISL3 family transposase [Chitinophagales bacterium]